MAPCIFCDIAARRASATLLHQTDRCLIFFDTDPIREGHVQIIPRAHYESFEVLPADLAAEIIGLGQWVARAMKAHYGVARAGFVFSGNDVAHAHAHVLPLFDRDDITSARYFEDCTRIRRTPTPPIPSDVAITAQELRFQMGAV